MTDQRGVVSVPAAQAGENAVSPAAPAVSRATVREIAFSVVPDAQERFAAWRESLLDELRTLPELTAISVFDDAADQPRRTTRVMLHFASCMALDAFVRDREPPLLAAAASHFGEHVQTGAKSLLAESRIGTCSLPRETRRCDNCDSELTGPYCSNCGQRAEAHVHSLREFLSEALETMTHADSRLWRTLGPLLCRPGFLTNEFLAGRRARYLPPFRLYFIISLLFFLLIAALPDSGPQSGVQADGERMSVVIGELGNEVRGAAQGAPGAVTGNAADADDPASTLRGKDACNALHYTGPLDGWLGPRLRAGCIKAVEDGGRSLGNALLQNVPRAMFIFLPLFGAVMKLMYWRPRRYYVEHLLYLVHTHAFVFLFFGLYRIVTLALPAGIVSSLTGFAAFAYVVWYLYVSLRRVYGESHARTLPKFAVLSVTYLTLATVLFVVTILLSIATL